MEEKKYMFDMKALSAEIAEKSSFIEDVYNEFAKVIIGQKYIIERLLISMLSNGHVLLEGVPGLAKTSIVHTMSKIINASFQRIQFTPDLLPADLLGTMIYNQKQGEFTVKKGPIFANMILADEINRSPAKVQSALLEAMQERQVTIAEYTYPLEEPFLVLATQNPLEQEGTYPLPEAQVDRFIMKLKIGYPTEEEELNIMRSQSRIASAYKLKQIINLKDILEARSTIDQIYIDEKVEHYIVHLIMASRYPQDRGLSDIAQLVQYGASPRATISLNLAAKAHAFIQHRAFVTPEDVRAVITDILRHRIIVTFEAEAENVTSEDIIEKILNTVHVP